MTRFELILTTRADRISVALASVSGEVVAIESEGILSAEVTRHAALAKLRSRQELGPDEIQAFGRLLGRAAFPPAIFSHLGRPLAGDGFALALRVGDDLADIPWEFLFLEEQGYFVQHPGIRLHRIADGQVGAISPSQALRSIVAFADPRTADYGRLQKAEEEFETVCRMLSEAGEVQRLPHATAAQLRRALERGRVDVIHFLGHADLKASGGLLVLEGGSTGEASTLYADELAALCLAVGVKLVVLSGCRTAGASKSFGTQLAEAGIPAVIGMQAPISDTIAHLFSRSLYAALLDGSSLEGAIFEARAAIAGSGQDWGAPVLLTSSPHAAIFSKPEAKAKPIKGNLPKPITSFIGREAEMNQCAGLVGSERCLVLLGSGGIGKTRLSIEIGRTVQAAFKHGVWQVLLDAIVDPDEVMSAIGTVFGIRASVEHTLDERVLEFLSDRNLLLILDNCEQVVEGCKKSALAILTSCPGVHILATSRTVLGTGVETVLRVPSMSYPATIDESRTTLPVEETIEKYEAVRLLATRSKSTDANLPINEVNVCAFAGIGKRLDGIPFALELAASGSALFAQFRFFNG